MGLDLLNKGEGGCSGRRGVEIHINNQLGTNLKGTDGFQGAGW